MLRAAAAALLSALFLLPVPAHAQDGTTIDDHGSGDGGHVIDVGAGSGGSGGSGNGSAAPGSGGGPCLITYKGAQYPCTSEHGWWSSDHQCWVEPLSPGDAADLGLSPGGSGPTTVDGGGGDVTPRLDPGTVPYWCTRPDSPGLHAVVGLPPGAGPAAPPVDPAVLAQQAVDSMHLKGAPIGTAPPASAYGLVNAPVWLWVADPGPDTWGPISATATAGPVSVTATARATGVVWDMGDGATVACGKGVPYTSGADPARPPCGHTYTAKGRWSIAATTAWDVQWTASTGAAGSLSLETRSSTSLDIREALAVVTGSGRG